MNNLINMEARHRPPRDPVPPDLEEVQDGSMVTLIDHKRAVYTVAEVSRLLSLSRGGTYELVRTGEIPAKKLGGRWVIPKRAFHDWLDSCIEHPEPGGVF